MVALYIILGIILFFWIVLSIRAHVHAEYESGKELTAYLRWAFLKITLLPAKEKQPKPKEEKPKEEKKEKEDEKPKNDEAPKPKKANPLKTFYDNEGLSGVADILKRLLAVVDKFGRRLVRAFVIDEMFLDAAVSRDDAAATAEEYGKVCRKIFPLFGAVCANCNVKKYSINVDADYLGKGHNEFAFSLEISLNPRKLINAVIAFAFAALFKVLLRFLKGAKNKEPNSGGKKGKSKAENTEKTDGGLNAENGKNDKPGESAEAIDAEIVNPDDPRYFPKNQVVYGKYGEGTVSEPDIYDAGSGEK